VGLKGGEEKGLIMDKSAKCWVKMYLKMGKGGFNTGFKG
jgi:hypothetical protein